MSTTCDAEKRIFLPSLVDDAEIYTQLFPLEEMLEHDPISTYNLTMDVLHINLT